MEEEEWILRYKPTRFAFIPNYFFAGLILVFLFSLLPFLDFGEVSSKLIFLLLLGTIAFFVAEPEIIVGKKEYILAQKSLTAYDGKKSIEIPYREIKELKIEQNFLGKFIDYGNLSIESEKEKIKMDRINNPEEVYKIINYKVSESEKKEVEKSPEPKPKKKISEEETEKSK